jgi:tetratricopeptide (TPR) repeat protein
MQKSDIAEFFRQAVNYLETDKLVDAKKLFLKILAVEPKNVEALHLLGVVAIQSQNYFEAIDFLQQAITLQGHRTEFYNNLGIAYKLAQHYPEAIEAFYQALDLCPESSEIHLNLANILKQLDNHKQADIHFRYIELLTANPIKAHYQAAMSWLNMGHGNQSIKCFAYIVRLKPDCAVSYTNLGCAYFQNGDQNSAIACFQQALILQPDYPEAFYNLGVTQQSQNQYELAIINYQHTLEFCPDHLDALKNLAYLAMKTQRINESIHYYRQALAIKPEDADLHASYSLTLLLNADFAQGWQEYEWRWRSKASLHEMKRHFHQPGWRGENLQNLSLFVYSEQGFGDTLQFCRYIKLLHALGCSRIIFECQPALKTLMSQCFEAIADVIAVGETLPDFDRHCPLMSLPLMFGSDLDNIPAPIPYLWADKYLARQWQSRLGTHHLLRVGLTWAGNPSADVDGSRSLLVSQLSPLFELADIEFFSLQISQDYQQNQNIIDHTSHLIDYTETAGLISQLDLIISVDTSVAHLAGAMGKPVWLLSRFDGCWRWLLNREDSPWYPNMRIFRQQEAGNWQTIIEQVAISLKNATKNS